MSLNIDAIVDPNRLDWNVIAEATAISLKPKASPPSARVS
jgi:hypothetical protein